MSPPSLGPDRGSAAIASILLCRQRCFTYVTVPNLLNLLSMQAALSSSLVNLASGRLWEQAASNAPSGRVWLQGSAQPQLWLADTGRILEKYPFDVLSSSCMLSWKGHSTAFTRRWCKEAVTGTRLLAQCPITTDASNPEHKMAWISSVSRWTSHTRRPSSR